MTSHRPVSRANLKEEEKFGDAESKFFQPGRVFPLLPFKALTHACSHAELTWEAMKNENNLAADSSYERSPEAHWTHGRWAHTGNSS